MLSDKNSDPNDVTIKDGLGNDVPLSLTWDDQDMGDDTPLITVQSREKNRKSPKKNKVVFTSPIISVVPMSRRQKKEAEGKSALNPSRPTRVRDKPDRYK